MSEPVFDSSPVQGATPIADAQGVSGPPGLSDTAMASSTMVGNMGELREKSPETFELIQKSIASRLLESQRRHQDRITKIIKEGREQH